MDDARFDALARQLVVGPTRRSVVGFATAGLVALLGLGAAEPATAKCPCGPCHHCKQGHCRRRKNGRACPGGTCRKGKCRPHLGSGCLPPTESCIADEQCCGAVCALINCNPSPNAGAACCIPAGEVCEDFCECCKGLTCDIPVGDIEGTCTCPSGQTACRGACVNTQTDVNNCGACAHVCGKGEVCCSGACTTCPVGGSCSGTSCVCPSGKTDCRNTCVDTSTDPNNCGSCGHTCPKSQACCRGACVNPQQPICG